jgi:hypothetical protein|tara:strand:+ start:1003 stop:1254 length:252 start_codon:yes stop_codon:yes gene_type:complete
MPFLRLPSLYGFIAVLLFLVMSLNSFQNDQSGSGILWGITAIAYFLRNIPKFFIFGFINIFAFILLIIGAGGIILSSLELFTF